ncbi:MAG: hypothetical protein AAFO94_15215 [Bacteroidota bacterium]
MKSSTLTLLLLSFGITSGLYGQFTQLELFTSLDKTTFNLYSNHLLNVEKTLTLATLGFFEHYRSEENRDFSEAGIQPTLFWNFSKNFSIGPSLYYNSNAGLAQRLSARYVFKNERLLIVIIPSVGHYQQKKIIYAETFAQFQLNVPIRQSLSFRVNGQFLNVWDAFTIHSRSFQQLRSGFSFNRHQLGLGLDMDRYGAPADRVNTIGIYYRTIL